MAERPFVLLGHDPDSAEKVVELVQLGVQHCGVSGGLCRRPPCPRHRPVGHHGRAQRRAWRLNQRQPQRSESRTRWSADILCGDYHASCLLYAALILHRQGYCELPAAVAMITANPARAFSPHDRGRIERGLSADLCLFTEDGGIPQIIATFKAGAPVYTRQANVEIPV